MHPALRIIHDEHQALAVMLNSITLLLGEHRRRRSLPDFSVLRAMLFYLDEFPERLHHAKETRLLFPKLRGKDARLDTILARLDADHARGERAIRDLGHALLAFEMMGESRREAFERALSRYTEFYLAHMHTEEHEVLPRARELLSEADWEELDEAFLANRDPLTGHDPDEPYRALFSKIVMTAPAPVGLGPALV